MTPADGKEECVTQRYANLGERGNQQPTEENRRAGNEGLTVASLAATSRRYFSQGAHTSGMAGMPLASSPAATTSARRRCATPAPVRAVPAGVSLGGASFCSAARRMFTALRYWTDSASYSSAAAAAAAPSPPPLLPRIGSGSVAAPILRNSRAIVYSPMSSLRSIASLERTRA